MKNQSTLASKRNSPYDLTPTFKPGYGNMYGPPDPKQICSLCLREFSWIRWLQQLSGCCRAYDFYKRPICEWCNGVSFAMRARHFPDNPEKYHRNKTAFYRRMPHDHMQEWQMWVIWLERLNDRLKTEIRISARPRKVLSL